jgi:glycosyltransferase involved in cell wall biosynthesis
MKRILVRGPALSQSGYGEHTRFVLRALRMQESELDIHVLPTGWGETGWLSTNDEERQWLDSRIQAGANYLKQEHIAPYDITVQVTIPNEWEKLGLVNIGITAGIETNKVSPIWLQKCEIMDKIITISKHAKYSFENAEYHGQNKETGAPMHLKCNIPIEVVGYPVKNMSLEDIDINLDYDFNYLAVCQWGPRKNMGNLIKWFVEENHDQEVGLIVKTSLKNNSIVDREYVEQILSQAIPEIDDRKCKIYLLHGDMSEPEMHSLYKHSKVKALISLSHGEGFGLPLFEAAYSGLPIIAPGWSGQTDFLYAPPKNVTKKNKSKLKPYFADVDYNIGPVDEGAIWPGVIEKDTMWCYPTEGSFKMRLRQVRKNYDKWFDKAKYLQNWVCKNFDWDEQHKKLSHAINKPSLAKLLNKKDIPKVSIITSVYDGDEYIRPFLEDITKQTIFEDKCELILINANSPGKEEPVIQEYLEKYPDNIIYRRLEEDPGIYAVWNMGVEMSSGEYLTNANLDDRKASNSIEMHARELCVSPETDLVYSDMLITDKPNETFKLNSSEGRAYSFPNFSYDSLRMTNMPHAAPMWRKSYHDKYGLFDDNYKSAGDWELWLRGASQGSKFKKINGSYGLYYFNPKGISTNPENFSWKRVEEQEVYKKYKDIEPE